MTEIPTPSASHLRMSAARSAVEPMPYSSPCSRSYAGLTENIIMSITPVSSSLFATDGVCDEKPICLTTPCAFKDLTKSKMPAFSMSRMSLSSSTQCKKPKSA